MPRPASRWAIASADAAVHDRIATRLSRAAALLARAEGAAPQRFADSRALRAEAKRLRPRLEELVGRSYGALPFIGYRVRLEARVADPWSQYLTLGLPGTRLVRIARVAAAGPGVPTLLAHELAHRYAFDESVTTLRGLEVSARCARDGESGHGHSSRVEMARLLLGAAIAEALETGADALVDGFFDARETEHALARAKARWRLMRARRRPVRRDWALQVYDCTPLGELEAADAETRHASRPLAFPRFAIDGPSAVACAAYTAVDALTGRRRAAVPLDATLGLWRESAGDVGG